MTKPKRKIYVCTVQIAVVVAGNKNAAQRASDSVMRALGDACMPGANNEEPLIIDWHYTKDSNKNYMYPQPTGKTYDPDTYEELEAFDSMVNQK
jgi:hypothetical protein